MIVAIDTSTPITSVAVVDGDLVLASAVHNDAQGHAEVIGGLTREVLATAGIDRADRVVCGVGPGPYTGLRVGVAFARALGIAWQVPVDGVCSLDAVAFGVHQRNAAGGTFAVAMDARRREVFWARYDASGDRVFGPVVERPADVPRADAQLPWFGPAADLVRVDASTFDTPQAQFLAQLVHHRGLQVCVPAFPVYLRAPDAALPSPPLLSTPRIDANEQGGVNRV